jgi:hypothetical protein
MRTPRLTVAEECAEARRVRETLNPLHAPPERPRPARAVHPASWPAASIFGPFKSNVVH